MNTFRTTPNLSPLHPVLKRAADLLLILLACPILIPLYLLITLMIRLQSPGPIHYTTTQINHHGRPIRTTQFRTFRSSADHLVHEFHQRYAHLEHTFAPAQQAYRPQYTPLGRLLTQTRFHNLPRLFNVITGRMSLVGLAPRFREQLPPYPAPLPQTTTGILSLWSLAQHRGSPTRRRHRYDRLYLKNQSLMLDLKILLKSLKQSFCLSRA